jgi:hypothetical protein
LEIFSPEKKFGPRIAGYSGPVLRGISPDETRRSFQNVAKINGWCSGVKAPKLIQEPISLKHPHAIILPAA